MYCTFIKQFEWSEPGGFGTTETGENHGRFRWEECLDLFTQVARKFVGSPEVK